MSVPLLGTEYFNTPRMDGVLSGKTAELLIQDGQKQAADIELQSTKAEAQFKAPAITDLYSSAYQKIANGDFTGFADMQKARSMAIGNPILMKTIDSADELAGHLANNVFAYSKQALSQEFQAKKQEDLQNRMDDRADKRAEDIQGRQDEATAKQLYMQEHGQWARQTEEDQRQYAAQMKVYEKQKAGYDEMVSLGQGNEAQTPAQPEKPAPRKEPKFEDFLPSGQKTTTTSPNPGGSILPPGASPLPSQGVSSQLEQGDQPLFPSASDNTNTPAGGKASAIERTYKVPGGIAKVYDDQPAPKGGKFISDRVVNYSGPDVVGDNPNVLPAQAIPTGKAVAALPDLDQLDTSALDKEKNYRDQYKPEELAPKPEGPPAELATSFQQQVQAKLSKNQAPEGLSFGYSPESGTSLKMNIHPEGGRLDKVKYNPTTGAVDKEITLSHKEDEAVKLINHFASDENLSKWIALQLTLGHPVRAIHENPADGKNKAVIFRTGNEIFSQDIKGPDGSVIGKKPNQYDEDDLKKWEDLTGMMGKVVTFKPGDLPKAQIEKYRTKAIADVAKGGSTIEFQNNIIQKFGGDPIDPAEVNSFKQEAEKPAQEKRNNEYNRRLDKELADLGFELPKDREAAEDKVQKLRQSYERQRNVSGDLTNAQSDLKALLKESRGKPTEEQFKRARDLQNKFNSLLDEQNALKGAAHRQFLGF